MVVLWGSRVEQVSPGQVSLGQEASKKSREGRQDRIELASEYLES